MSLMCCRSELLEIVNPGVMGLTVLPHCDNEWAYNAVKQPDKYLMFLMFCDFKLFVNRMLSTPLTLLTFINIYSGKLTLLYIVLPHNIFCLIRKGKLCTYK